MSTPFEFEDNQDTSQMNAEEKADYLKALISGRDSQNGRFLKGSSGNPKGRPRARTTVDDCFSLVFSQKTTITADGKPVRMTLLQAICYKIVISALADDDIKMLMQILKIFGSKIDISNELPSPKAKPLKEDPTVEMIKKAILVQTDKESGINGDYDN